MAEKLPLKNVILPNLGILDNQYLLKDIDYLESQDWAK